MDPFPESSNVKFTPEYQNCLVQLNKHTLKKKNRELTMIKCSNIIESTVSFVSNKRSRSSGNQEPTINSSHSKGREVVLLENEACC